MKKATLARIAVGPTKLIGPLLLLALILFPIVLFSPLLSTRIYFISHNDIVLARVAYDLFSVDKFLFVVVFVFGMVIPGCKMMFSAFCWYFANLEFTLRCRTALALLSKLSMLDIMLLAIFIIAFKGIGIGVVQIKYGLYLYVVLVLGSLILNLMMYSVMEKVESRSANAAASSIAIPLTNLNR